MITRDEDNALDFVFPGTLVRLRPALIVVSKCLIKICSFGLIEISKFIRPASDKCLGIVIFVWVFHLFPDMLRKNRDGCAHIG